MSYGFVNTLQRAAVTFYKAVLSQFSTLPNGSTVKTQCIELQIIDEHQMTEGLQSIYIHVTAKNGEIVRAN